MKYLSLSLAAVAVIFAGLSVPASALSLKCNPAVGNWQNAAPITCPFDSGGQGPTQRANKMKARAKAEQTKPKCEPKAV